MHRNKTFTQIPQKAFASMQLDAGVIVRDEGFNVTTVPTGFSREDIVCATTGGIQVSCVPNYVDLGEDVDNCPANVLELKDIVSWECSISFTSLGTSPELIAMALGAANADSEGRVVPREYLKTGFNLISESYEGESDFKDIWWIGDRADGGMVAVKLINALSTGGFTMQTTKAGKGQISVTLTGHVSLADTQIIPMEFYSIEPDANGDTQGYTPATGVEADATDTFTGDGTKVSFTLLHTPSSITSVTVSDSAVSADAYSLDGKVLTFKPASKPANNAVVEVEYKYIYGWD